MNKVLTFLNKSGSESLEILKNVHSSINNMSFHLNGYILYDLVNYIDKERVSYLEIGTYCGASACFIGKNNKVENIYCIDPLNLSPLRFGGSTSQEKILYNNLNKMNIVQKTKVFKNLSSDKNPVDYFKNRKVDILYIDGDHSFDGVVSDWENYMNCVCSGGFVVFDDYYDLKHSPKVKKAVDFIVENKLDDKFEVIGCPDNVNNIRFSRKNNVDKVGSFILLRK
jgi:predicted O-methyltransferase YrrM